MLAATLNPEQCLRVLIPIVMNSEESICLAAVKIESLVVKESELALIQRMAADLIPGLMKVRFGSMGRAVLLMVRVMMRIFLVTRAAITKRARFERPACFAWFAFT